MLTCRLQDGSFDEAMQGCDAVIHTASPYVLNIPPGTGHHPVVKFRDILAITHHQLTAVVAGHTSIEAAVALPAGKERQMLHDPALKGTENVLGELTSRVPCIVSQKPLRPAQRCWDHVIMLSCSKERWVLVQPRWSARRR